MFMQVGFAFCETGFTRAKNASHTMAMNLMVYGIGLLGYRLKQEINHYCPAGAWS